MSIQAVTHQSAFNAQLAGQSNLTTAQQLLWLGQKLAPESLLYNMAFLFTFDTAIDPTHFQAAWQKLLQCSHTLRSVIEEVDGVPQQRVMQSFNGRIPLIDLSREVAPQQALQNWAKAQTQKHFQLSECLIDTALIQLNNQQFVWYLNQHHLITDIASVHNIYQTMGEFYRRSRDGTLDQATEFPTAPPLSPPSTQAIDYWKTVRATPVALYHRTATIVAPRTRRVFCELGPARTARLQQLALASEATALTPALSLFNLIAGIFFAYLHRVSGSDSVSFATPAHGRPTREMKAAIGCFIELFPLQTVIDPGETFASLLTKVNAASGRMLRHAQPGSSAFAASRDMNVVLNFIQTKLADFDGRSVQAEWVHPDAGDPRHHLRLQVHDFDDRGSLQLHFDFNCDLFDSALQDRAPSHFLALVDAMLNDRRQPIHQVALINDAERRQLDSWGKSPSNNIEATVVQTFEAQVERTPTAIAVTENHTTLTYQQLNRQANQLAQDLCQRGVTRETSIAICLRRSAAMLVAILGILKAGGTYVPLDPKQPQARIAYILQDTQAQLIITQSEFAAQLPHKTGLLLLDQIDLQQQSPYNLPTHPALHQLAYRLYTSGSTGQPKGVEIEHRSLANYVQWANQQYVRDRRLAFPLFSPLTFDLTVTSIYLPLVSGGQIVIYPETAEAIDLSLQRIFTDDAVDVVKLTPSHLSLVQGMKIGSRVKTLILGGEDLKTSVAMAIATASDHPIEIYNEYGPTEATVGCMIHRFQPAPNSPTSVSIGQPAAGAAIYLLDAQLNLVPQGAAGEIFIGGPGLARGYLNQPALTADRFIQYGQTRLYRTGDRGRWEANGCLSYVGRNDRQVKVHGHRIELGEIESKLMTHPAIVMSAIKLISTTTSPALDRPITYCTSCGIASNYPGVSFDSQGICTICHTYETYRHRTAQYFKSLNQLQTQLDAARQRKQGKYDCMMLLSGGKDSTYALAQLVDMGFEVFAFTLDNGYISEEAKANIRRVVKTLNVDHQFGSTPAMNEIFVDSLNRHCNVCNGCFKTIYTLSMKLAYERGIPCIVTGLSRGQFFETRLTEEWFTNLFGQTEFDVDQIDATILEARKVYHRTNDAVSHLMDVEVFQTDDIFNRVEIIDFYRYCEVELAEMLAFLRDHVPWIRPSDTGRSTNCLINNVGIHLHTQKRGYHNYALPYSWDVRMGHKTPEAAIDELNDAINVAEVERILEEIGYKDESGEQLVAYYHGTATATELRIFLAKHLPSNLVPTHFIQLDQMPLTANGKVDFAALPPPQTSRPELQSPFVAATTTIEKTLVQLWQQVLKVNQIGIHDHFFDLGGDSIMAIQIAARMSEGGLSLSPNQIFQHPTIAALTQVVTLEVNTEQEVLTGSIPLTPIQQAFFEQRPPEPEQFTQTVLLDVATPVDSSILKAALAALITHHDSLRLRYEPTANGWEQYYQTTTPAVELTQVDLSTAAAQQQQIASSVAQLQTQLNLTKGDLLRTAIFNLGSRTRLALIVHHLAIDAVSWLTLLKDLETAYMQLSQGQTVLLPLKTSAFKTWADGLSQVSLAPAEIDYWLSQDTITATITPHDCPPQRNAITQNISRQLSHELTEKFIQLPQRGRPEELLLTALTLAMQQQTGQSSLRIDLEGHGREEPLVPGIRLIRTIGWFTSLFPITLTAKSQPKATLESVQRTLQQIPTNGIGYGILRYFSPHSQRLKAQPQAEILFNYLGNLEQIFTPTSMFRLAEPLQVSRSPRQIRSHPIDITALIHNGQLQVDWQYSGLSRTVVEQLADEMMKQVQDLLNRDAEPTRVEDFPLANLNQQKLNKLAALLGETTETEDES
ncbi:amino acid adenylation domain-containing protein [filamentous cyanobacterium LEGE 11480]|uniref:Amino acid adenylation domain-containing protein n=1 Tax=Romeriopsis navalis LEGE 11480 TaxID=2777977 RepID=A0A928Z1U4_9CYAN|nr:non-ribosomal peptide synthetase [Romeriopsis navalis]MBE9028849.1 amino acid adenylation domain-containing protein [Romeriopsis navalis LEGE 11480]